MQDCYAVFQPRYARFTLVRQVHQAERARCHTPARSFPPVEDALEVDASPRSVTPDWFSAPVADVTPSTTLLAKTVPSDGTNTKINNRRAGAPTVFMAGRPLSTGRLVQARRMYEETRVLPVLGGIRFGVRTCPATAHVMLGCSALAVPDALVGAVDR